MRGAVEGPSSLTGLYTGYQPYTAPQAPMTGNAWHSMIHGINIEGGGFDPNDRVPPPNPVQIHTTLAGIQPPLSSNGGRQVVIDNAFWKIGQECFWARAFQVDVINCTFADCGGDALQIAGSGGHPTQRGAGRVINTRFVGLSENRGSPNTPTAVANGYAGPYQQWFTDATLGSFSLSSGQSLVGWRIYDGPNHLIGCVFESYPASFTFLPSRQVVPNYAIAPRNGNVFFMQSLTSIESTQFVDVGTRFQSIDPSNPPTNFGNWSDGSKNTVLYDVDGSLSGNSFFYCMTHNFQYYAGPGCITNAAFDMCCPQAYLTSEVLCLDREAFGNNNPNDAAGQPACPPVNIMHQTRLSVSDVTLSASNSAAYDLSMNNGNEQWNTLWAVNTSYLVSFDQYTPSWTGFQIANTYAGDWLEFAYCLPSGATVASVVRGRAMAAYGTSPTWAIYSQYSPITAIATFAAFQALGATTQWPNAGGYYYWDQQRNIVHVHVQSRSFRVWGSSDVNSDYCGLDGCDFLVVHTTGSNGGVGDCPSRAFDASSNDGSLQVRSGSAFFSSVAAGPRINGPVQHRNPGVALYIDAGAAAFYAQDNAPVEGDPYFTDDLGLTWVGDEAYQRAALSDASPGFSSGFDHRVAGDDSNQAFMFQSVSTGNWEYEIPVGGLDTYVLSLFFTEVYWTVPTKRLFNILVNGETVFQQVDIFAITGGSNIALQLNCWVNLTQPSSTPLITVVAQRIADNPIVSGITVMPYSDFLTTFPGAAINPGTSANAPPIAAAPPVNGGGGGGDPAPPPSLPLPDGWIFTSPSNTSYVTGGTISTISSSVVVNFDSPDGSPPLSWESQQPQLFRTNRYGQMTYSIPVPSSSSGWWSLRILFAENYFATEGTRVFAVQVQGVTVIPSLDLTAIGPNASQPATTGTTSNLASTTAFIYAESLQLGPSQPLSLNFVPIHDNPLHCGILLIPSTAPAGVNSSTAAPSQPTPTSASVLTSAPAPAPTSAGAVTSAPATTSTPAATSAALAPTSQAGSGGSGFALLINAGATTAYTAGSDVWQADVDYNAPIGLTTQGPTGQQYANTSAALYPIYNSNRYNAAAVNYTLPVPSAGTYQLTLMFAETYWSQAGQRLFSVAVQGQVLVAQLDLFAAAGGQFVAYNVVTSVAVAAPQLAVQVVLGTIKDNALLSGLALRSV